MKQASGIKEYIIKNLPSKLSYIFKGSKPKFKTKDSEEILVFDTIPSYLIVPKITLDEIFSKWESDFNYDLEQTTDWIAERILSRLTCNPQRKQKKEQGKVIVLMGYTGCGKTTLKNMLIKNNIAKGITTYTTRKPRKNESALSYHFIDNQDFEEKAHNDFFLESVTVVHNEPEVLDNGETDRSIKVNYYGSAKADYKSEGLKVIVLDANGYLSIKDKVPCIPIFIETSKDTILKRCLKRGDDKEKVINRIKSDGEGFKELQRREVYSHFVNGDLDITTVYNKVLSIINKEV